MVYMARCLERQEKVMIASSCGVETGGTFLAACHFDSHWDSSGSFWGP